MTKRSINGLWREIDADRSVDNRTLLSRKPKGDWELRLSYTARNEGSVRGLESQNLTRKAQANISPLQGLFGGKDFPPIRHEMGGGEYQAGEGDKGA